MSDDIELNENSIDENEQEISNPVKVEKVSLADIMDEKNKEKEEKDDELVRKIMSKILEIK